MDKPYIKNLILRYLVFSTGLYCLSFGNGLDRSLFSWNYADFKSELCIVAQYTSYTWRGYVHFQYGPYHRTTLIGRASRFKKDYIEILLQIPFSVPFSIFY